MHVYMLRRRACGVLMFATLIATGCAPAVSNIAGLSTPTNTTTALRAATPAPAFTPVSTAGATKAAEAVAFAPFGVAGMLAPPTSLAPMDIPPPAPTPRIAGDLPPDAPLATISHPATPRATEQPMSPIATPTRSPATQQQIATLAAPTAPVAATAAGRPSGSQLLERTFPSPSLGRQMHYFIYLPSGYAESGRRYSVMYMLHGWGGSDTEWVAYGFPETADKMMNAGEIPPMIIVMPQGDQSYWTNHADGTAWGDYAAIDLVAHMDATYRTVPDAAHRAIGGLSMGGHGAMQLALNYPNTFSVVGMHSPTLRTFEERWEFFGDRAFFTAHDPVSLVQTHTTQARELKIMVDVGAQDDLWRDSVTGYHDLLTALGIPHLFQTWPGEHNKDYWGPHCRDYLRFYAANLAPA